MLNKDEYVGLYESGMTYKELADHYGITVHKAKYWGKKFNISARKSGTKREDLTGKRMGKLVVVSYDQEKHKYECICDCGKILFRQSSDLLQGKQKMCWACRNKYLSTIKWKGIGELSMDKWIAIQRSAKVRNLSFEITIQEAWELFEMQNRKCALSGLPLEFHSRKADRAKTTASLDRIDSGKGYTIDNVQWVHKFVNTAKMDMNQAYFIELCKAVANYNS